MNADHRNEQNTELAHPTVRRTLLELAKLEDDRASDGAATIPYWEPYPTSVEAHRLAAEVLRAAADRFLRTQPANT
jgi:hypothetical protein